MDSTTKAAAEPTTSRSVTGYIPHDSPLAFAASLAIPYELPKSNAQCISRFGRPGRRVVIHIIPEEFSE